MPKTAVSEVLASISRSAFDLDTVLATITERAGILARAEGATLYRREGNELVIGALAADAVKLPSPGEVKELQAYPAAVTMVVGLILTRFGCLARGCCAGRVTDGRVGVWLPNARGVWARRFPTQIIEAGWGSVLLAAALIARPSLPTGGVFALLFGGYAGGRLLLEPTREAWSARRARANVVASGVLIAAACALLLSR